MQGKTGEGVGESIWADFNTQHDTRESYTLSAPLQRSPFPLVTADSQA